MKAVFDTTVLVSAFISPDGLSDQLLQLAGKEAFDLILGQDVIRETETKLLTGTRIRKHSAHTDDDVRVFIEGLPHLATIVAGPISPKRIVRDVNDDMVVACALHVRADYIVTRDKDLLVLGSYQGVTVTTPERFRTLLRDQS